MKKPTSPKTNISKRISIQNMNSNTYMENSNCVVRNAVGKVQSYNYLYSRICILLGSCIRLICDLITDKIIVD